MTKANPSPRVPDVRQKEFPARDRLIFPLDVPTLSEAKRWVNRLNGHVGLFKVGLELFTAAGPDVVRMIADRSDAGIFLDLKFHDIPETIKSAARSACRLGARFITVHAGDGPTPLKAAVAGAGRKTKVLVVTVLTSIGKSDVAGLSGVLENAIRDLVMVRAHVAGLAGCAGVVCSGMEVAEVKRAMGKKFLAIVPGIRPAWARISRDDQRRIVTPFEAITRGADYIVVGRPIRDDRSPTRAADRVVGEIEKALEKGPAPG